VPITKRGFTPRSLCRLSNLEKYSSLSERAHIASNLVISISSPFLNKINSYDILYLVGKEVRLCYVMCGNALYDLCQKS